MSNININIEADFGSDWQEETNIASLTLMVVSWALSVKQAHKKNKIDIGILSKGLNHPNKIKELTDKYLT